MKQNSKVVLLVTLVAAGALLLYFIPPIGTVTKRVWMLSELFPDSSGYISEEIPDIAALRTPADSVPAASDSTTLVQASEQADSIEDQGIRNYAPVVPVNLPDSLVPIIDYSGGHPGGMSHIISLLRGVGKLQRKVRIAYYGDSFVESDILTCDLRQLLQDRFGGQGVGWTGCKLTGTDQKPTVGIVASGITDKNHLDKGSFKPSLQGPSLRYYLPQNGSRLTLRGTAFRRHVAQWSQAQLYIRTPSGMGISYQTSNDSLRTDTFIDGSDAVQVLELMGENMTSLDYRFTIASCINSSNMR
mgnify:CR=1 FL=1